MVLTFIFALSSCNNKLTENEVTSKTTENVEFNAKNMRIDYQNNNDEKQVYPYVTAIYNNQELENFYDANKQNWFLDKESYNTKKSFRSVIDENYDENFFENNFLLVAFIKETYSSNFHKINTIEKSSDGSTMIDITRLIPSEKAADEGFWIIPIEVDLKYKSESYHLKIDDLEQTK